MQLTPDFGRLLFEGTIRPASFVVKKNNRPIFRSKKTGRSFIGKSPALVKSERDLLLRLRGAANEFGIYKPIVCKVVLWILFDCEHTFNADGSFNKRQQDLDNLLAGPLDALQAAEIISNDNLIMRLIAEKRPSDETKIEIKIYEYDSLFALKND